jgi:hypothetical protein
MVDFLKWGGPLIVAVIALGQPWAIALWQRFFRQGTIDIHETGSIEIGYSNFGATIGLNGTLRAVHRDQFVRSVELVLTKLKDSSRHVLEWGVFRSQKISLTGSGEAFIELPAGFMLTTAQPQRYNIQFYDTAVQQEMSPHVVEVQREWQKEFMNLGIGKLLELGVDAETISGRVNEAYAKFSATRSHVNAYTALDRLCYWEPGRYSLLMRVNTARPERSFTEAWTFELSEEESNTVRFNAVSIVQAACGRASGEFQFAYAKYQQGA